MARAINRLKAVSFESLGAGKHADGDGLYLQIDPSGARRWLFMYRVSGKRREMGLGSAKGKRADQKEGVGLGEAREKAAAARALLRDDVDPLAPSVPAEAAKGAVPTFGRIADDLLDSLRPSWRNPKHTAAWELALGKYAAPLRSMPVNEIEPEHIEAVLKPIWRTKAETARRVRGRIEKVLSRATALKHRAGPNPAVWRGTMSELLSKPDRKHEPHPRLPYALMGAFMVTLRAREAVAASALEFTILTAARSGETLGATWGEIDAEAGNWIVPGQRMKGGRAHTVPLAPQAMAILKTVALLAGHEGDDAVAEAAKHSPKAFIFPGQRHGRPLSGMAMEMLMRRLERAAAPGAWVAAVPHGFRSSFRDWCGDKTNFPREVAEAALSHLVGNEVERAYRRGDALEKRRELMIAWADYCDAKPTKPEQEADAEGGEQPADNVVPMRARGGGA